MTSVSVLMTFAVNHATPAVTSGRVVCWPVSTLKADILNTAYNPLENLNSGRSPESGAH